MLISLQQRIFSALAIFFVLALALGTSVVHAQEITRESVDAGDYGDFVVGPGKVDVAVAPGESRVVFMTVTNRLGTKRVFNLEIEDAAGSQDPAQPVVLLGDDRGPYTLKDYLSAPEMSFTLDAGERARIPVTISIPADAEPGGRYGSVLVTTTTLPGEYAEDGSTHPSSAIVSRIGTLFFITTPGDIAYEGQLASFTTIPDRTFFAAGPIRFSVLYENSGSAHVNPYGSISVTNMLGEEVGFLDLDPWYALPQSLRFRESAWDRDFLFGRYTAHLELHRGYDDQTDYATVTFWVLPWRIVLPTVGGIILLILIVRYITTRFEFKRKQS